MKAQPDSDTLIEYALGNLEPSQHAEVEAALLASPALALELAAWQKSLSALAATVPQSSPRPQLEGQILAAIRQPVPQTTAPRPMQRSAPRPMRSVLAWTRAASVVSLALAGFFVWRGTQLETQITALQTQAASRVATLAQSSSIRLTSNQNAPIGQAFVSGGKLVIALQLPEPPKGKTYQAWVILKGETAPRPLETLRSSLDSQIPSNVAAIAISLEPVGGSKTPTEVLGVGSVTL